MDVRAEIRRLTAAELTIVAAASLLFIDSFLPWYRYCVKVELLGLNECGTSSAWDSALSVLAILVAVALATQIVLMRVARVEMPALGTLTWRQAHLAAATGVLALVVLELIVGESPAQRWIGLYTAVVLAAALLYGALRQRGTPPRPESPGA
jgi:hypothetical protein